LRSFCLVSFPRLLLSSLCPSVSSVVRFPVPSSTLWTIQPAEVLERIAASGIVRVERRWRRGDVPEAYWWLRKQLRRRLPGYRGGLPWWFYWPEARHPVPPPRPVAPGIQARPPRGRAPHDPLRGVSLVGLARGLLRAIPDRVARGLPEVGGVAAPGGSRRGQVAAAGAVARQAGAELEPALHGAPREALAGVRAGVRLEPQGPRGRRRDHPGERRS
jgi:hypothetical protein